MTLEKKLFYNSHIVCMDDADTHADAVLVHGDRIIAAGSEHELRNNLHENITEINLEGNTLYPGLIDTHSHLELLAAWAEYPYCGSTDNLSEALEILADYSKTHPEMPVIFGYGFDDTAIKEERGPTLEEMDKIFGKRPAMLLHISIHAAYINTAMLNLLPADLCKTSNDKPIILPPGKITENSVFHALNILPQMSEDEFAKNILYAMSIYNSQGITSCIGGGLGLNNLPAGYTLRTLGKLELENALTVRCNLPVISDEYAEAYANGLLAGPGSPFVRPHGMKIFTDGSIQAYTAALRDKYFDNTHIMPGLAITRDKLNAKVLEAHSNCQQVIVHANGDAAIESAITALERAQEICPRSNPHHLLIHCQTVSDDQLKRMKDTGFEPSFFVLHIWNWGDRHKSKFLGPYRAARLDPCGSAVKIGLPFALHADTPVLPQMTMLSIHTAVNRQTSSGDILGEDQKISPYYAMRAYTTYAAKMCLDEKNRGSIEPGKLADFTAFDNDPRKIDPEKIKDIKITHTIAGGKIVFSNKRGKYK